MLYFFSLRTLSHLTILLQSSCLPENNQEQTFPFLWCLHRLEMWPNPFRHVPQSNESGIPTMVIESAELVPRPRLLRTLGLFCSDGDSRLRTTKNTLLFFLHNNGKGNAMRATALFKVQGFFPDGLCGQNVLPLTSLRKRQHLEGNSFVRRFVPDELVGKNVLSRDAEVYQHCRPRKDTAMRARALCDDSFQTGSAQNILSFARDALVYQS